MEKTITYNDISFSYLKLGTKPRVLLCIHGYADNKTVYRHLFPLFEEYYTIISIDFFHHGNTRSENQHETYLSFSSVVRKIITNEGLNEMNIDIAGYSMGGRIAVKCAEKKLFSFEHVFLFAPDGLYNDTWRKVLNLNIGVKKIISKLIIRRKRSILFLSKIFYNVKFISKTELQFVDRVLQKDHRIKRLLGTWLTLHHFEVKTPLDKDIFASSKSVFCYLAKNDKVISTNKIKPSIQHITKIKMRTVNGTHFILRSGDLKNHLSKDLSNTITY